MASRGINKVILIGNCGREPETRYGAQGNAVTTVSVATSDTWRDRQSGETQERTEWHRVVMFSRLAEVARDYLHKGSKVYIEGRLQTRKWQTADGAERYTTEVVANDMQMLDSRGGGQPAGGRDDLPADRREVAPGAGPPPAQGARSDAPPAQGARPGPPPAQGARPDAPPAQGARPDAPPAQGARPDAPPERAEDSGKDDFEDDIPF